MNTRAASLLALIGSLTLPACGGVEVQSDFADHVLVAPYAMIALDVHGPFSIEADEVGKLDQPMLDRFRNLVEADLESRGKQVTENSELAGSVLRADLIVEHTSKPHWILSVSAQQSSGVQDHRSTPDFTSNANRGRGSQYVHNMGTGGGMGSGNQLWYTYVLTWHLQGIDEPAWVGTVHARSRYGGGDVHEGTIELLELLFRGEEQLTDG